MYTYLRVHVDTTGGRLGGELAFRKAIQDALAQSFGTSAAATYVDVLRLRCGIAAANSHERDRDDGSRGVDDAVIRVARDDAQRIKAALATAPTRLSIIDEAHFLPALLASG